MQSIVGVVDVTRVHIQKPTLLDWQYYSMKDKFHALKYEVAVSFNPSAKIIWVKGPYKGAPSDIRIAREALVPALRQRGEKMLADKGYLGDRDVLVCPIKEYANIPLTQQDRSFNRKLNSFRNQL